MPKEIRITLTTRQARWLYMLLNMHGVVGLPPCLNQLRKTLEERLKREASKWDM